MAETSPEFNILPQRRKVLVAPLDWGLGHATRCIPLIRELIFNGCEVLIAAGGQVKALLQNEFPELEMLQLPGYEIRYSRHSSLLPLTIAAQLPRLWWRVRQEHRWLQEIVYQKKISLVISDNRFGLYHRHIPSVYITHQLSIKTGNRFTEMVARKLHQHYIQRYSFCWVPDFEGEENMAGELSHPVKNELPVQYIGAMSRFQKTNEREIKYDLLVMLSGPEPQRSIFEKRILDQLNDYKGKVLFVRGLPGSNERIHSPEQVTIINHLPSWELNDVILRSDCVVSRSGYTTVMDLVKLGKKAILVPTPGQTEQEYLGTYLMQKGIFYSVPQHLFSLNKALAEAAEFPFRTPVWDMDAYKKQLRRFVESL